MDSADVIMNTDPVTAAALLSKIRPDLIRSPKDQARYALLYTESQYKNYQPIETDSIILKAVRYYSNNKNPDLLFRSYYCLGCIYSDLSCHADAIIALSEAEKLTDYVNDDFLKG